MVCEEPPPEFRDEEHVLCIRGRLSSVPRNKPMPMVRRLTCEGEEERVKNSEWVREWEEKFAEVITIAVQGRRWMGNKRVKDKGIRRERGIRKENRECCLPKSFWRNLVRSHLIVAVIAVFVMIPCKNCILTMYATGRRRRGRASKYIHS